MNWQKKYMLPLIISIVGGIAGFLYWNFIGCTSGSCAITSVWYNSTVYGTLMGWLGGGIIRDLAFKKPATEADSDKTSNK